MKVLKIGAVWCNSCLVMKPRWEEIEKKHDWLKTEYFEYDDNQEVIEKYNIESEKLPVFIFLDKNGNELERVSGEPSVSEIEKILMRLKDK